LTEIKYNTDGSQYVEILDTLTVKLMEHFDLMRFGININEIEFEEVEETYAKSNNRNNTDN